MAEASKDSNAKRMNRQFEEIIAGLQLSDLQTRFLRDRWLDQLLWFENKAHANQRRYYALRLVTIVGGLIVPALVSLNVRGDNVAEALEIGLEALFCHASQIADRDEAAREARERAEERGKLAGMPLASAFLSIILE